jgi:hypothetical protein
VVEYLCNVTKVYLKYYSNLKDVLEKILSLLILIIFCFFKHFSCVILLCKLLAEMKKYDNLLKFSLIKTNKITFVI